jgi:2-deoxy-D-gluconate 3-dehydrogenase
MEECSRGERREADVSANVLDQFKLEGKNALVTGGAGELGQAMVQALAEAGASVVIVDSSDGASSLANSFRARGLAVSALKCDIRDRHQIRKTFADALESMGGAIDILVNCAGVQRRHPSEQFPEEDWDAVIEVNLNATFIFCQLAARGMIIRGAGKIINIASVMSFFGGVTIPAYAASKGGVAQLTKALSNDWAPKGICVNAIAPGYMDTQMNTALSPDTPRFFEIMTRIPVGRWGKGDDLKGIVVFLASTASDYITGAVIPIDGGYSGR